jgi:hypothetical protein
MASGRAICSTPRADTGLVLLACAMPVLEAYAHIKPPIYP